MCHITLSNLILIIFVLCSSINIIHLGQAFDFYTTSYSDGFKIRVFYPKLNKRILKLKYDGKEDKVPTNKNDAWINGLKPCTTYTIEADVKDLKTQKMKTKSENKTTQSVLPKTKINLLNASSGSVNVSFEYENYNCIQSSQIFLNNVEIKSYQKPNVPQNYVIEQLAPCTSYNVSIIINASTPKDAAIVATKEFTTRSITVFPIEDIKFNDRTNLLTWNGPNFGRQCIKGYDIVYANDLDGTTVSSITESYRLLDLSGCSNFTIYITPKGINNLDFEMSKPKVIRTGFTAPSSVENLKISHSNTSSIRITWDSPNKNPNCVRGYQIQYNGYKENTYSSPYTIGNLEPCHLYSFQVCVVTINNEIGICSTISGSTSAGIPGKVEELRSSVDNPLHIDWKPPIYGEHCVNRYELNVFDELGKNISNSFVSEIKSLLNHAGLKSCQRYKVSVTPYNEDNVAGPTSFINIKTQSTQPDRPVSPSLSSKSATSLELKSEYKSDHDLCQLRAVKFKCENKETSTVHWKNVTLTDNVRQFTTNVTNLKDLTKYVCVVYVENDSEYLSDPSAQEEFETNEQVADPPQIIVIGTKPTSFKFGWSKLNFRIKLQQYHVRITYLGRNYSMPAGCHDIIGNVSYIVIDSNLFEYEIYNLAPYTKYTVEMAIENTAGIGTYGDPVEVVTEPDVPHQVTNFHIAKVSVDQTVEVKWSLPCEMNGEIISVRGQLHENISVENTIEWKCSIGEGLLPTTYIIDYVFKPECFYNITIEIELNNFDGPTNLTWITMTTPAGIPEAYNSTGWGEIEHESSPFNNVVINVGKTLFVSTKGKINHYTFLISQRSCIDDPKPDQMFFVTGSDYVNLPSWYDYADDQCTKQYQLRNYTNDYSFDEANSFEFIIGNETCDVENRRAEFCNGALKSGTDYAVIARVFTSNGYADTQPLFFTTSQNVSTLTVIFIALSILLAGFIFGIGFMRFKASNRSAPVSSTDIAVKSFLTFYSHMEFDLIVKEYESIDTLDLSNYTTEEAKNYREKNRYGNILPYDQNRVILSPNTYCTSDYINASYIQGYKLKHEYIATQGPKPETLYDFWHMVIESKCHKIVMLTKLVENGITKCCQYYPDPDTELILNDIKITNIREDNLEIFTRRELKLTKGIANRLVVQYHFQKWPDHDCPENEMDLIKFIQFLRSDNKSKHPMVVHCSAGVGRTGTLISLDILMQQIQNKKYLNVYETVKKLRYQRVKMVQTFEQYEFLYKSLAKYIRWKWPVGKG